MRGIMLFVALVFLWMPAVAGGRTEALLDSLDRAVARKSVFVAAKSARIDQLKGQPARTLADKYSLSKFLFNEYATFDSDSAWFYANRCAELAGTLRDSVREAEAGLFLALAYTNTGLFDAARNCLEDLSERDVVLPGSLERLRLEVEALYHFHLAEYVGQDASGWQEEYNRRAFESRERLLAMPGNGHPDLLWQRVESAMKVEGGMAAMEREIGEALARPESMQPQSRARLHFSLAAWKRERATRGGSTRPSWPH